MRTRPDAGRRGIRAGIAVAILVSLILVCARIATFPPTSDEAKVAVPAWNLAHHGFAGTTILADPSLPWKGINRRTYNTLPGGILYLASWFSVFPATILSTRTACALWGPVLLAGCFVLLRRLTGNLACAVLGTVLLGLDYNFILGTALARVDVMTAALGMAALASYCEIRLRSLKIAILVSSTLAVLACLTHPQGVLYVLGLVILAVYLDRRSLAPVHFALAAIPFAICGTLWLGYVARDPAGALSQLRVNAVGEGRFPASLDPFWALRRELRGRYLQTDSISVLHTWIWKLVILLIPFGSAVGILLTLSLGRQRGLRTIVLLTAAFFMSLTLFDNSKSHSYLIHVEAFYSALIAVFALYCWRAGQWKRVAAALTVAAYILIRLGGVASRVRADSMTGYGPALSFLQKTVLPSDLVVGESSFWFDCCGPGHKLVEDPDLGVRSGLSPDYIVDDYQSGDRIKYLRDNPALVTAMQTRLSQFDLVYDYQGYRIYRRRR